MPHDIVWIWSRDRVEELARTYADCVEGSRDAPMLYVSMSPGALLRLMRSMDLPSVAAMVRMPGEAEPTERTLNPWVVTAEDVVLQPGMVPTIEPPTEKQIREAQYKAKVEHGPKCSQCGQNWDEWACGPTHAMLREQMGIEPRYPGPTPEQVDAVRSMAMPGSPIDDAHISAPWDDFAKVQPHG